VIQPIDDHFLLKYRELLDAEDAAFDELEHACEDGDHARFDEEMKEWRVVLARKAVFLNRAGIDIPAPVG
jgi:hypothetical protein